MTMQEAQLLTLRVLKQVMEEKLDHHNVQLAQVNPAHLMVLSALTDSSAQVTRERGFQILDEKQLKEIIELM
jgi:20S proteasome subunit alpha 5